jgi:hypothetical protein
MNTFFFNVSSQREKMPMPSAADLIKVMKIILRAVAITGMAV